MTERLRVDSADESASRDALYRRASGHETAKIRRGSGFAGDRYDHAAQGRGCRWSAADREMSVRPPRIRRHDIILGKPHAKAATSISVDSRCRSRIRASSPFRASLGDRPALFLTQARGRPVSRRLCIRICFVMRVSGRSCAQQGPCRSPGCTTLGDRLERRSTEHLSYSRRKRPSARADAGRQLGTPHHASPVVNRADTTCVNQAAVPLRLRRAGPGSGRAPTAWRTHATSAANWLSLASPISAPNASAHAF
jgi:hypothetical protein